MKSGRVVELERTIRKLRQQVGDATTPEDEERIGDEIRRAKRRLADAQRRERKQA